MSETQRAGEGEPDRDQKPDQEQEQEQERDVTSALPVRTDNLCLHLTNEGRPCRTPRKPGTDFCYRHQTREAGFTPVEKRRAPFPELPSDAELETAEGVRSLLKRLLEYIAKNEDADLPRVYAAQGYAGALLRTVDVARLESELASARLEMGQLERSKQELRWNLERERARPKSADLEELEAARAENRRLTERNGELESRSERGEQTREELQELLEEQHELRTEAEKAAAKQLERMRKVHRSLCYGCSLRVRPVIGGEPELGDSDVERSQYVGSSR